MEISLSIFSSETSSSGFSHLGEIFVGLFIPMQIITFVCFAVTFVIILYKKCIKICFIDIEETVEDYDDLSFDSVF